MEEERQGWGTLQPSVPARADHPANTSSLHYLQSIAMSQCDGDSWGTFLPFITLINLPAKQGWCITASIHPTLTASGHLHSHLQEDSVQGNFGGGL